MSCEYDGACDVYKESLRRARKEHKCDACREPIITGELYSYTFMVYDGERETVKRCARCELIYRHLEHSLGNTWEEGIDRRLQCGHSYEETHDEPPPDEIAALAFCTHDEAQGVLEFASMGDRR